MITKNPDLDGYVGKAWRMDGLLPGSAQCGAWIIRFPSAPRISRNYYLTVVGLREAGDRDPARLDEVSHELLIFQLDPNTDPQPHNLKSIRFHKTDPHHLQRLCGLDDVQAATLARLVVSHLVYGRFVLEGNANDLARMFGSIAYYASLIAKPEAVLTDRYVVAPTGEAREIGITCLTCGRTSYNRNDVANRYCAQCHEWLEAG